MANSCLLKVEVDQSFGKSHTLAKTTKQMSNNDDCEPSAPPLSLPTVRKFSSFPSPNGADFRRQQIQKYTYCTTQQQLSLPTYLCALWGENRGSEREEWKWHLKRGFLTGYEKRRCYAGLFLSTSKNPFRLFWAWEMVGDTVLYIAGFFLLLLFARERVLTVA